MVRSKLGVDAGELDIDRGYAGINLYIVRSFARSMRETWFERKADIRYRRVERGLGCRALCPEEAIHLCLISRDEMLDPNSNDMLSRIGLRGAGIFEKGLQDNVDWFHFAATRVIVMACHVPHS